MEKPVLPANPLAEAERTTPAGRSHASQILCLRFSDTVKPILSVQREFSLTSGIRRGFRDYAGRLIMDHVLGPGGQPLFGRQMRLGTVSVWEHQLQASTQLGNRNVLAIAGNGNLTQNPYFVAWFGHSGELVRLANEPVTDRAYDCLVVDHHGASSVRCLRFQPMGSLLDVAGWRVKDANDEKTDLTSSIELAFSGQRIVSDGQPLTPDGLSRAVLSGLFYDLRHVFRFAAVKEGGYWKDVGLEQFYDHGSLNGQTIQRALAHEPIRTRWTDLTADHSVVRKAFSDKGYVESPAIAPGNYRLDGGYAHVVYSPGIYCHNLLGLGNGGKLMSMQVTGKSNNAGATLLGLSTLAAKVFEDAILLDNGGDVFFISNPNQLGARLITHGDTPDAPPTAWVESCEQRYNLRSAIIFAATQPRNQDDVAVVEIPYVPHVARGGR